MNDACELCSFRDDSWNFGGKVYGSMSRSGEVRGHGPKDEKQWKKKKKTGRAELCMQYYRCFVSVAAGFGRKKGPKARS